MDIFQVCDTTSHAPISKERSILTFSGAHNSLAVECPTVTLYKKSALVKLSFYTGYNGLTRVHNWISFLFIYDLS
jgi:hypothetical protein